MLLNSAKIRQKGIVKNAADSSYRNASYDLRIATIVPPASATEERERFALPPQGIVEVISAERVALPTNVMGYAMVKTTLCNSGILAINIGIVDPGYSGLISSTMINLGKEPFELRKGDVFLRLVFHEYEAVPDAKLIDVPDAKYIADAQTKARTLFAETFLDLPGTIRKVSGPVVEEIFAKWRTGLFVWVPTIAFTLALLSFLVNWGSTWSARNALLTKDSIRTEITTELRNQERRQLEDRLIALEQQIKTLTAAQAPAPTPTPPRTTPPRR